VKSQPSIIGFLDVIACGFGAVVLLVLILPVGESSGRSEAIALSRTEELKQALTRLSDAEHLTRLEIASIQGRIEVALSLSENLITNEEIPREIIRVEESIKATTEELSKRRGFLKDRFMDTGIQERGLPNHLYGIPVDSDYLAFVVDTSGSMQKVWPKVIQTIKEVLTNYPELRGFRIVSDQGEFLLGGESGWLSADPSSISRAIEKLRSWKPYSNSSPVEGIEVAVSQLFVPGISLGLFVVGDDYTGTDFDGFLGKIDSITAKIGRTGQLRIHALGFFNDQYSQHPERFTRLMQVLTFNNGGAFLYMGSERAEKIEISRNRRIPIAD
jgi:hypothetical protein